MDKHIESIGLVISRLAKDIQLKADSIDKYSKYAKNQTITIGSYMTSQSNQLKRSPAFTAKERKDILSAPLELGDEGIKSSLYSLSVFSDVLGIYPKSVHKIIETVQTYLSLGYYKDLVDYLSLIESRIIGTEINEPSSAIINAMFEPGRVIAQDPVLFKTFTKLRDVPNDIVNLCTNIKKYSDGTSDMDSKIVSNVSTLFNNDKADTGTASSDDKEETEE